MDLQPHEGVLMTIVVLRPFLFRGERLKKGSTLSLCERAAAYLLSQKKAKPADDTNA